MSKKAGTKTRNIYHRKDQAGDKNDKRVTCKLCDTKHYISRYHHCIFKKNVLDLYCCAGGAGYGYYQAGYNVTGIDIARRPNYFCDFIQADAIEYLLEHGHEYDFVHTSPPCQKYSRSTAIHRAKGKQYVDLVDATRAALIQVGKPAVIENVPQAPLRRDLELRGEMFGLKVIRQRIFEFVNMEFQAAPPPFTKISVMKGEAVIVFGNASWKRTGHGNHGDPGRKLIIPDWRKDTIRHTWAYAMGIDHYMTDLEIAESIPPAYTKWIGENLNLK